MEGEEGTQTQQLILANKIFLLTHPDVDDLQKVRLRDEVFNAVVANGILSCFDWLWSLLDFSVWDLDLIVYDFAADMAPLYQTLIGNSVLNLDQKVLDSMRAKIDEELKKLDEKWVYSV